MLHIIAAICIALPALIALLLLLYTLTSLAVDTAIQAFTPSPKKRPKRYTQQELRRQMRVVKGGAL